MGRSYRVELNKSESMRDRNLIADAKLPQPIYWNLQKRARMAQ
jgi:hypothetical protein